MTAPVQIQFRAGGQTTSIEVPVDVGAPPPPPPALEVRSFSPSQAPVGSKIIVFGYFPAGAVNGARIGGVVASVTQRSTLLCEVFVPAGALSGVIRIETASGFAVSAQTFTVGPLLPTDGPATLPRRKPRWWDAPPSRNSVPNSRIFRLPPNYTAAQLKTAMDSASAAAAAGTAWVLVPPLSAGSNYEPPPGSGSYEPPRPAPASAQFPVVLAEAEWFDGAKTYSPTAQLTRAQADLQPIMRSVLTSAASWAQGDPFIRWTGTQDFVVVGIRMHDNESGTYYCRELIAHGQPNVENRSGDNVGHFAMHWCSGGLQHDSLDRPFTSSGVWREGMGRGVNLNGSGFAWRNSYWYGHGAPGSVGSDRGVFNGFQSSGPWYVKGNNFRDPGGIPCMHGGALNFPGRVCEDVEITENDFWRRRAWNANDAGVGNVRTFDANGLACPYSGKVLFETKTGAYWRVHRNLFRNDYSDGQVAAVNLNASWQGGGADEVGAYEQGMHDLAFTDNLVTTWNKGAIAIMHAQGQGMPPGALVGALTNLTLRGNIFSVSQGNLKPSGPDTTEARMLAISMTGAGDPPPSRMSRLPSDVFIKENLFYGTTADGGMRGLEFSNLNRVAMRDLTLGGNIFAAGNRTNGSSGVPTPFQYTESAAAPGTGLRYVVTGTTEFVDTTLGVNAWINFPSIGDTTGITAQSIYATPAAAGLTITSPEQFALTPSSPLRTAAGGGRVGPDFDALEATRTAILAGVVS